MKKYNNLLLMKKFQQRLDSKFGRNVLKAGFILLLMGMLSSCGTSRGTVSSTPYPAGQTSNTQGVPAGPTSIIIEESGQTETPNTEETPEVPVHRIRDAYFAKKTVTNNGATVDFTRIDSGHTQENAQGNVLPYDSILGKTVYLVVETENLRGLNIDVCIRPADVNLTGNVNSLELMYFNYDYLTNNTLNQYLPVTRFIAEVGDLRALNNRDNSREHYTNLETHQDKAIIKLQLRPNIRATFDTWTGLLAAGTANLEIVACRQNFEPCAYRDNAEEITEAEVFLGPNNDRFRIVNRNFYEIYNNENNLYNFLSMYRNNRKKIRYLENENSTQVVYIYIDQYDNELPEIATCDKTTVMGRNNGIQLGAIPRGYIRSAPAPAGGNAQTNYYYQNRNNEDNEDIVTDGNFRNSAGVRIFPDQLRKVRYNASGVNITLVRMPDGLNITLNNITFNFTFSATQRRFCNPECFAAFVGVLGQYNNTGIRCTGMCFGDATSYPSVSHPNGDSVDTGYMQNQDNQIGLLNAFLNWNFTNIWASLTRRTWLVGAHRYDTVHDDHLHSGDFDSNSIENMY